MVNEEKTEVASQTNQEMLLQSKLNKLLANYQAFSTVKATVDEMLLDVLQNMVSLIAEKNKKLSEFEGKLKEETSISQSGEK